MGINFYGLMLIVLILIPNLIFAMKHPEGFENKWSNKLVETLEQIGRFGCFIMMVVKTPWWGFSSAEAFIVYIAVSATLTLAYIVIWAVCFKKSSLFRALALSIIPSVLFIFCGAVSHEYILLALGILFAPCHIAISVKNAL